MVHFGKAHKYALGMGFFFFLHDSPVPFSIHSLFHLVVREGYDSLRWIVWGGRFEELVSSRSKRVGKVQDQRKR